MLFINIDAYYISSIRYIIKSKKKIGCYYLVSKLYYYCEVVSAAHIYDIISRTTMLFII